MPAYKDLNKTWRSVFYYKHNNVKKQMCKRGFATKREALKWEREFLNNSNASIDMKFENFYKIYMDDMKLRIEATTYINKETYFKNNILPHFSGMSVNKITPIMIRQFQNNLLSEVSFRTGKKYKAQTIQKINAQLSALFNHAVNFFNLKDNPCKRAGSLKLRYEKKMNIWTVDEFNRFTDVIRHKPISYAAFNMLFWTGMRTGELLALTWGDLDFDKKTIIINKSYTRLNGKDKIKHTKNKASDRTITISDSLAKILKDYSLKIYDLTPEDRIFPITKEVGLSQIPCKLYS